MSRRRTRKLFLSWLNAPDSTSWEATLRFWQERMAAGNIQDVETSTQQDRQKFILVTGEQEMLGLILRHDQFQQLHTEAKHVWLGAGSTHSSTF